MDHWWQSLNVTRGGSARSEYCYRCAVAQRRRPARAQTIPSINDIQIEGNQRVEADAIRLHIKPTAPANRSIETRSATTSSRFTRWAFFRTSPPIRAIRRVSEVLVYRVTERPQITDVKIVGMKAIRSTDDEIVAAMKLHPGSIIDPARVNETKKGIKDAYESQGLFRRPGRLS